MALLLPLWAGAAPTRATITLTVTPAVYELDATPGATGQQIITLANDGDQDTTITTAVEPFQQATGELSATDWLSVNREPFTLKAGESRDVPVAIAIPDGLAAGARYALVTFSTGVVGNDAATGAAIAGRIGAAIMIRVDGVGDLVESGEIVATGPVLDADGRLSIRTELRNTGNVHLRPAGAVTVLSGDGTPFGALEMPFSQTILPGRTALLNAQGSFPVQQGATYRVRTDLQITPEETLSAEHEFTATAALSIANVAVCENLDRGPTVTVALRNDGGVGLLPRVQIAVRSDAGGPLGDVSPPRETVVWTGASADFVADLPERLVSGDYTLTVTANPTQPTADGKFVLPPVFQDVVFSIGGLGETAIPLCPPVEP